MTEQLNNNNNGHTASLVAQVLKNLPATRETQVQSWIGKVLWRREWQEQNVVRSSKHFNVNSWVSGHFITSIKTGKKREWKYTKMRVQRSKKETDENLPFALDFILSEVDSAFICCK